MNKTANHRSDSDSESVFTDDEEWAHPLPLRDNSDRCLRPSDSSVENESFIVTYSQRFSRRPGNVPNRNHMETPSVKVVKNKKNLLLDLTNNEKNSELQQWSDTENSSPGLRNIILVTEESRSHQLSNHNINQFKQNFVNLKNNCSATSSPELINLKSNPDSFSFQDFQTVSGQLNYMNSPSINKEGNVFRYDFLEKDNLPPVNRQLKPKINVKDKISAESFEGITSGINFGAIDKNSIMNQQTFPKRTNVWPTKVKTTYDQKFIDTGGHLNSPKPPSIDRKLKPNLYKLGNFGTMGQRSKRSLGTSSLFAMYNEDRGNFLENSVPCQPLPNSSFTESGLNGSSNQQASGNLALQPSVFEGDHKLQYFELDVANQPPTNRQSISVGNLCTQLSNQLGLTVEVSARIPASSSVVYNSVDFIKTEAFKRIREERKKESEGIQNSK